MVGTSRNTDVSQSLYGMAFDGFDLSTLMTEKGHDALLKMQFHALGDGWVELVLHWNEGLAIDAHSRTLASGPIIGLLDNVTGVAVWQRRGMITHQVTVDLRLDFLREPAPGLNLIGRGECYGLTRDLAFVRGIAYEHSPDDPVASATGTYMQIEPA
jgi:acyl-coenzyme A thioesterase PaaI-like protein